MNNDIRALLIEYIETVNTVCLLLLKMFNLSSKEDLYKYRRNHQVGEFCLNGKNQYMFHGIGCRFWNDKLNIDWDFGHGDEWCGIDPYKFYHFIKDNNKLPHNKDYLNINFIIKELEKAVDKKEMIKKDERYYFSNCLI